MKIYIVREHDRNEPVKYVNYVLVTTDKVKAEQKEDESFSYVMQEAELEESWSLPWWLK